MHVIYISLASGDRWTIVRKHILTVYNHSIHANFSMKINITSVFFPNKMDG